MEWFSGRFPCLGVESIACFRAMALQSLGRLCGIKHGDGLPLGDNYAGMEDHIFYRGKPGKLAIDDGWSIARLPLADSHLTSSNHDLLNRWMTQSSH